MMENMTTVYNDEDDVGDAGLNNNGSEQFYFDSNGTSLDIEEYDYEDYDYDYDDSIHSYDWTELGPSIFVYSVTFIAGIVGNILILLAVIRHTHVKNSPVNVFLASLASADLLLILICLPLKVRIFFPSSLICFEPFLTRERQLKLFPNPYSPFKLMRACSLILNADFDSILMPEKFPDAG